jgi:hypothetical protein
MISITITPEGAKQDDLRATAAYLLMLVGDMQIPVIGPQTVFVDITHAEQALATKPPFAASAPEAPPIPPAPPAPDASSTVPEVPKDTLVPPTVAFAQSAPPPASVAPPAAPPTANRAEVDSEGLPWDGRIHASTKGKTQGGVWKARKNVADATRTEVVAELRQLMGLPGPAAPIAITAPVVPSFVPAAAPAVPPALSVPGVPPVPTAPSAPPPPVVPQSGDITFAQFMVAVQGAINAGTITGERMLAEVMQAGVPSLPLLSNRTDLIPGILANLGVTV